MVAQPSSATLLIRCIPWVETPQRAFIRVESPAHSGMNSVATHQKIRLNTRHHPVGIALAEVGPDPSLRVGAETGEVMARVDLVRVLRSR